MSIAAGIYRLQHTAEHRICIFKSFVLVSRRKGHVQGTQVDAPHDDQSFSIPS